LNRSAPPAIPLGELFRDHWKETIGGTFGVVACFCIYYIATAFALGYGTTTLAIPRETFLQIQLVAILFMAGGIVVAGYWSDATTPRLALSVGCALSIATGFLIGPMMGSGDLLLIGIFLSILLLMMGFVYGPLGAWLPWSFPGPRAIHRRQRCLQCRRRDRRRLHAGCGAGSGAAGWTAARGDLPQRGGRSQLRRAAPAAQTGTGLKLMRFIIALAALAVSACATAPATAPELVVEQFMWDYTKVWNKHDTATIARDFDRYGADDRRAEGQSRSQLR